MIKESTYEWPGEERLQLPDKLEQIVAAYFADLRDKRGLGAGTPERSYYPAMSKLLDAIGEQLKPKVLCLSDLSNTGAGQPDFGLYVANQVQRGEPRKGQAPERGVIEMKSVKDDAWVTAGTKQVSKYWGAYRLVIVTNLRDFLILGEDANGHVARLETFRLAKTEAEFWEMVAKPQGTAKQVGRAFGEYLRRALTQSVALREPKDGRGCGRTSRAREHSFIVRGSARRQIRGRKGRALFPIDARADAVLRRIFIMGPLGKDYTATVTPFRLEDGGLASQCAIRHDAVSPTHQPGAPPTAASG